MLQFESERGVESCDGIQRRDFLRVGALAAGSLGLSVADLVRLQASGHSGTKREINCILLMLIGGPSQLDTWDLKPLAPAEVRGPFQPMSTSVPGVSICEHFPKMSPLAQHYALVRSVQHTSAPIHETGHQLLQTGRLARAGVEYPHYGAVLSYLRESRESKAPPFVVVPGPIANTGVSVGHGQTAGFLGQTHDPLFILGSSGSESSDPAKRETGDLADLSRSDGLVHAIDGAHRTFDEKLAGEIRNPARRAALAALFAPAAKRALNLGSESHGLRARYGMNTFGQSCLLARRLVEGGVRCVTVNMFDTVFDKLSWDCHADGGSLAVTLADYRDTLCPMFDQAYSALLEDLRERGLLEQTLVLAMGEFGRTPYLNPRGGRDHWTGCWTVLFAGGGVRGGQVIGASDHIASEPIERPVSPGEIAATVYQALGIDLDTQLPGPGGEQVPLVDAEPIRELLGTSASLG